MAATNYTPISLYYSTTATTVPSAGNLVNGELAINIQDEKLYFKNAAGTVKLLASNATSAPVTTFSGGTTGLTPSTATSGAVTLAGTLAIANGGTGATTLAGASIATYTGTETLTNKTFTGYTETVYALSGTAIDPANGTIQTKTLGANTTFTESLADGQSVVLMINTSTYTVTWPTITWINTAGSGAAPTLEASSMNVVVMWQVGGTLYGNWVGSA